jgi:hypothetical protein
MTNEVSAINNPQLANKMVAEALEAQEAAVKPAKKRVETPPDTHVELAAGLIDPFDGFIGTAEVRELNGADEEAIAKAGDTGKALLAILERAVVRLGEKAVDRDTLDMLLAGDRELILLTIRRVTFGDEINFEGNICPCSSDVQEVSIDLNKDVKVKKLDGDRLFTIKCKIGEVEVSLPNGITQKAIVNSSNKTAAELDTLVLKSCVKTINGLPVMDTEQVRQLSVKDRRDILKAISNRNPGPQLSEVTVPCKFCGSEVPMPLTLAELFQE